MTDDVLESRYRKKYEELDRRIKKEIRSTKEEWMKEKYKEIDNLKRKQGLSTTTEKSKKWQQAGSRDHRKADHLERVNRKTSRGLTTRSGTMLSKLKPESKDPEPLPLD